MRRTTALLTACHPEPTAAVTVVACVLAAAVGRGVAGTVAVGAAVLAGQLSVGWSNDWFDAGRDAAAGRGDKPTVAGAVTPGTLRTAALAAAAATVPLSLASGLVAGSAHLAAVGSAWLYNRPLKGTVLSALPYLVSFALLPAFVVLGVPATPPWWLCAAGGLLGGGAHFFNALPDLADDRATGVRGLPQRLGPRATWWCGAALLLAASAVLAFAPPGPAGLRYAGLCVAVVALGAGALAGRRWAFRTVLVVAVVDVALLVLAGTALPA